ncbi:DnaJ C-terminal domain-containing protein [Streptomyces sp. NPDC057546]|uniref:DnaJ C-terminal domain-containing protein n=1 Tax=Streptomyces sp. NPDC057546 TaxID=3346165 RepID=UPI00367CF195
MSGGGPSSAHARRPGGPLRIRIPAGIRTGQVIRLREFGAPGRHGGAPGNLYVTVHVDD